ncbi:hypothetical protein AXG93_3698s1010 [Marchantia polymorpha subsp. ruderalis]|uniref:Uncharacterized protein n=1 Tax=Marchantia polymorpha subsp. ruderalis TaxID=1480154 RepID=A0A176VZV1_MARPO|nr:hypothetical protein AXG93_3698s1010 [Marchantia polymorpha subsp. ruderalis]
MLDDFTTCLENLMLFVPPGQEWLIVSPCYLLVPVRSVGTHLPSTPPLVQGSKSWRSHGTKEISGQTTPQLWLRLISSSLCFSEQDEAKVLFCPRCSYPASYLALVTYSGFDHGDVYIKFSYRATPLEQLFAA